MTTENPEPTLVSVEHGGITYTGEVIRSDSWHPTHGQPLTGDALFRIVFLADPTNVFPRSLHDHRIAVYVPGERTAELERAEVALRSIRAAMGTYATDADTFDMLSAETRQIEDGAVDAWADSFQRGHLIAAPSLDANLEEIFADGYWSTWAERIGKLLLQRAYPSTPVRAELLQIPLRPESDAPVILAAALGASAGDASAFALDSFGPALGLSSSLAPRVSDISKSEVVQRLSKMVDDAWAPADIGHALAHEMGLTYPLATAFLLLWISVGHHSLRLRPGHGLKLHDGSPLDADSISAANAASLKWPSALWPLIAAISQAEAPATADPFLAALAGPVGKDEDIQAAASRRIAELQDDLPQVAHTLTRLATAQRRQDPPRELAIFRAIAASDTVDEALAAARKDAPTPALFAATMALWQSWANADDTASGLATIAGWLDAATIDEAANALFTEREALVQRIKAPRLLTSPHEWAALLESARLFQHRYAAESQRHHREYHAEISTLTHTVDDAWRKTKALEQLNNLSALGTPLGHGLPALAREMRNAVIPCDAERQIADIEATPLCPTCGLHLGATPPSNDVQQLAALVDEALGEQNRRLALALAHRILERPGLDQIDRFIQVVQVSDLMGLANILDEPVVTFIKDLLDQPEAPRG
jgi:hypothetical protein